MFQELSKNVRKYYNLQKKTVLNLELPKITRLVSCTYCDLDEEKLTTTELALSQIMPLSDCKLQKQPPEVFCKKGVPRNLAKFLGKHLCQGLYFNKVAGLGLQLY